MLATLVRLNDLISMFEQINADVAMADVFQVVPLTDVEYYSYQIESLLEVSPTIAACLAEQMAYSVGSYVTVNMTPTAVAKALLEAIKAGKVPPKLSIVVEVLVKTSNALVVVHKTQRIG